MTAGSNPEAPRQRVAAGFPNRELLFPQLPTMSESYLVIGGSGFLGRHIVEALQDRGDNVATFDVVQRHFDVPFYLGDITNEQDIGNAIQKVRTSDRSTPVSAVMLPERLARRASFIPQLQPSSISLRTDFTTRSTYWAPRPS